MWPMIFMLAGSAMQAGGSAFGAAQALKQSKYQQDIFDYAAKYEKSAREIDVAKLRNNVAQTISAQRAATAASGFQADSGTALELQIDTEMQGEIDISILRMAGGIEQLRLQNAGTMSRAQGYGVAAGLYQRGFGSLLNTGMSVGSRTGWFEPASSTATRIPYIPAK